MIQKTVAMESVGKDDVREAKDRNHVGSGWVRSNLC